MTEQPSPYRQIDDYIIQARLEDGGMSNVYKGYDTHRQQDVVIKILHERYVNHPDVVERFKREIEIAKELHHTHIVPFFGFGDINGKPYMALKYMPGGSLSDVMKRGRIPLLDAAKWLTQIAAALDYAHRRGVIHRDIKPGNVLLDANGDACLSDFGIARVVDATQITRADMSMPGTARFMSPEQAVGKQIDSRSDIYSLAVLAYVLCVGDYPFDGENDVAIVVQHINAQPPRPNGRNPDIPRPLDKVILRGMNKNPDSRYPTAGDFAAAFSVALGVEQTNTQVAKPSNQPIILAATPYKDVRPAPARWFNLLIAAGLLASVGAIILLAVVVFTRNDNDSRIVMEVTATPSYTVTPPDEAIATFLTIEPNPVVPPFSATRDVSLPSVTPVPPVDVLFPTLLPGVPSNTPRPTNTPAPPTATPEIPNDWIATTRLYVQYETGIRPFVGAEASDMMQLQPGDIVIVGQGIVEGGARREWFGTEPNRWWYIIPTTRGDSGWLPEDALGEERPPEGGIPTRTATPTSSPTPPTTPTAATGTPSSTVTSTPAS